MNEIEKLGSGIEYRSSDDIVADARSIIDSAQRSAHQAVNVALVVRNWLLGRRIAEEELGDDTRPELYGRKVVPLLAKELTEAYGRGFTRTSLYQCVQFYRMFPEIVHAASGQSRVLLTWTHYRELLRVQSAEARVWYEQEAASQGWSVKQLSRNISSQYCERMLSSHAEPAHGDPIVPSAAAERAERLAFVKSPMVMEFLGLPANPRLHESDLEGAILDNLQQFLLELGKGYAFVARQQHIRTEWDDFFIDLVFYNYILRCFVLIDLKTSRVTHQDVGQMDMYVCLVKSPFRKCASISLGCVHETFSGFVTPTRQCLPAADARDGATPLRGHRSMAPIVVRTESLTPFLRRRAHRSQGRRAASRWP